MKRLTVIVISGTIASGKSATARALAREVERRGGTAAAIDLDLVYEMLEHDGARKDDEKKWTRARHAAGALANRFAADGVEIVIVEGEFLTADDRRLLVEALDESAEPRFVTLRSRSTRRSGASTATRRAPSRATATSFAGTTTRRKQRSSDTPASDLLVDTEGVTVDDVAALIADWAIGSRPS